MCSKLLRGFVFQATDDFLLADECRDRESCAVFSTSRDSTLDLLEYGTSPGFKNMWLLLLDKRQLISFKLLMLQNLFKNVIHILN